MYKSILDYWRQTPSGKNQKSQRFPHHRPLRFERFEDRRMLASMADIVFLVGIQKGSERFIDVGCRGRYSSGMPRPLRPIDDGLVYHVINRGNNRQDVFHKDADFAAFLQAVLDLKQRKPFELYGYCLLNNHFHLLIRPTGDSISRIMQSLLVSHTQRYHKHYRSGGHVWQGRFKSPVIQSDEHLLTVLRYIEANPLRAGLVKQAEEYPWSSYRAHGAGQSDACLNPLVTYEQLSPYPQVRQRKWAQTVHEPQEERELAAIRRSTDTGLPYGSPAWVKRLSTRLHLDLTIRPRGRPRKSNK